MKRYLLSLCLMLVLLVMAVTSWAAIAVYAGNGYVTVTLDGTNDFQWSTATVTAGNNSASAVATLWPNGWNIWRIDVAGGAAGSKTVVTDQTLTGAVVPPYWYTVDGSPQLAYYNDKAYKPNLKHSAQTSDTGTAVTFWFNN